MALSMVKILNCKMNECSYNNNNQCHAMAITVGADHPACDTYYKATRKGGNNDMTGSVGACKVEQCKFNNSLACNASGINVDRHTDHADCRTFSAK